MFILLIPTFLFFTIGLGPGAFLYHEEYSLPSSDGEFAVKVFRRVEFPVFGILDFPARVSVRLVRTDTGTTVHETDFEIHEYPELTEPRAFWEKNRVNVRHIESHEEVEVSFSVPNLE